MIRIVGAVAAAYVGYSLGGRFPNVFQRSKPSASGNNQASVCNSSNKEVPVLSADPRSDDEDLREDCNDTSSQKDVEVAIQSDEGQLVGRIRFQDKVYNLPEEGLQGMEFEVARGRIVPVSSNVWKREIGPTIVSTRHAEDEAEENSRRLKNGRVRRRILDGHGNRRTLLSVRRRLMNDANFNYKCDDRREGIDSGKAIAELHSARERRALAGDDNFWNKFREQRNDSPVIREKDRLLEESLPRTCGDKIFSFTSMPTNASRNAGPSRRTRNEGQRRVVKHRAHNEGTGGHRGQQNSELETHTDVQVTTVPSSSGERMYPNQEQERELKEHQKMGVCGERLNVTRRSARMGSPCGLQKLSFENRGGCEYLNANLLGSVHAPMIDQHSVEHKQVIDRLVAGLEGKVELTDYQWKRWHKDPMLSEVQNDEEEGDGYESQECESTRSQRSDNLEQTKDYAPARKPSTEYVQMVAPKQRAQCLHKAPQAQLEQPGSLNELEKEPLWQRESVDSNRSMGLETEKQKIHEATIEERLEAERERLRSALKVDWDNKLMKERELWFLEQDDKLAKTIEDVRASMRLEWEGKLDKELAQCKMQWKLKWKSRLLLKQQEAGKVEWTQALEEDREVQRAAWLHALESERGRLKESLHSQIDEEVQRKLLLEKEKLKVTCESEWTHKLEEERQKWQKVQEENDKERKLAEERIRRDTARLELRFANLEVKERNLEKAHANCELLKHNFERKQIHIDDVKGKITSGKDFLEITENDYFDQANFKRWISARLGNNGDTVFWYSMGELYDYPNGNLLVKVEGLDVTRALVLGPSVVHEVSRKIFLFRHKDSNELICDYNGSPVLPVVYPHQRIVYMLDGSRLLTEATSGSGSLATTLRGNVVSVRHLKSTTNVVFTCPNFLNLQTIKGSYQSYENYDYFMDKADIEHGSHCSMVRIGSTPPFADSSVMHLSGWRLDKYDLLPLSIKQYLDTHDTIWKEAPLD